MIIAAVEVFSEHMRACLLSGGGGSGGGGALPVDVLRTRLLANLRHLREAYDSLLKLDLPSQVQHTAGVNDVVPLWRSIK